VYQFYFLLQAIFEKKPFQFENRANLLTYSMPLCGKEGHRSYKKSVAGSEKLLRLITILSSVAEPHHFDAAPAPGKIFDAAPAPTLLHSKAKF
jgi:hypothetical protein